MRVPVPPDRLVRVAWAIVIAVAAALLVAGLVLLLHLRGENAAQDAQIDRAKIERQALRGVNADQSAALALQDAALAEANRRLRAAGKKPVTRIPDVVDGLAGADGRPGARGRDGAAGRAGEDGDQGARGGRGSTGPAGRDGATGAPGAQGERGATGDTGATGAPGPQGPPGAPGADGQPGPQGPTGPPGEPGPMCPPGWSGGVVTVVTPDGPPGQPATRDLYVCTAS